MCKGLGPWAPFLLGPYEESQNSDICTRSSASLTGHKRGRTCPVTPCGMGLLPPRHMPDVSNGAVCPLWTKKVKHGTTMTSPTTLLSLEM